MTEHRVVITGVGTVNPAGRSLDETWAVVEAGAQVPLAVDPTAGRAFPRVGTLSFEGLPVRQREINRMNRADALGVVAAARAAIDGGWSGGELGVDTGLFLATSKDTTSYRDFLQLVEPVASRGFVDGAAAMVETATRYLTPFLLLQCMPNLALHYVSEIFKVRGDNCCFLHTGASGAATVAAAYQSIRRGTVTAALAGGFDSPLDRLNVARLASLGVVSSDCTAPCRPFDERRDGFLPGEGAAVMLLEARDHAAARHAHIYGEIVGCGAACETTCDPMARTGQGVGRAIGAALAAAHVAPDELAFVAACGDGTRAGDRAESRGVCRALDAAVPVTAYKGVFGHLMAAAGPLELMLTIRALHAHLVPTICGCDDPAEDCEGLAFVHGGNLAIDRDVALLVSTGTGGQACALVVAQRD